MINYLKMINWRAYDEREIHFKKGITFLMGANGSGKTSILEAISYALTGEAALFAKGERSQLLRDPSQPGSVVLKFDINEIEYEIQRTQNPERAGEARMIRLSDQKVLAQNHTSVTKQVEKLLSVSDDFLRRIVYMAEGDVFNFLNTPPKDALDTQIRSVLGLTQLDQFSNALVASEKHFKARIKTLQDLNSDLARLEVHSMSDLESRLSAGEEAKKQLLDRLDQIGRDLGAIEQSIGMMRNVQKELDTLSKTIQLQPDKWSGLVNSSVLNYFDQLQEQATNAEKHHAEIRILIGHSDGQEEAYQRILSLLEPYQESSETVPCPVCRKPLTQAERVNILEEIHRDVDNLKKERSDLFDRQNQARQNSQNLQDQLEKLRTLRNILAHTPLPAIHPSEPFEKLTKVMSQMESGQDNKRQSELVQQRDTTRQRLSELENYQAEYQAIMKRLQDFSYKSPEELDDELVRIEVRMLSIRAAAQATEATLQSQQEHDMSVIYQQIANLWSSFREEEDWQVGTNSAGYPVITNAQKDVKLDLRQLSGGEKTALLIMLHTIIAHHFSKSDFLMIDEPLEHLDPINRRSLIKFLVDAYRHQICDQAIIATFEESLIRKYQSNEGVNIILV